MQNDNEYYSMMGLLKEDSLRTIFREGKWYQFKNLQEVIKLMEKRENGDEDKHSIPDVYGRALQLRISMETLMNRSAEVKKYLITKEILVWRGIITVVALQNFLHLKMKVDIVKYDQAGNAFDKALKYPPKTDGLNDVLSWGDRIFHIITLKGDKEEDYSDIAMFSPMTLFYPVADVEAKMPGVGELKWFDRAKGKFVNPTDKLSKTEKMIVCFWINKLKAVLENDGLQIIRYHLDAYEEELKEGLVGEKLAEKKCFKLVDIDDTIKRRLNHPVINMILNTTVTIIYRFEQQDVIYYDELFADQLYYTRKPDNPFNECSFKESHKIAETRNWYAFLPLGKRVGEISDRKIINDLIHNFKMSAYYNINGDMEYVQVSLHLSNISESNVDAEKRYYLGNESDNIVEETEEFPTIALWPKKNTQKIWTSYIYITGGKSGKIELNFKGAVKGSNPNVRAIHNFPKVISLKRSIGGKEYDIGMILPEYEENVEKNSALVTAIVGIDFGTSGTTIFSKIRDENIIFPISIQGDTSVLLTKAGGSSLAMMSQYFVASEGGEKELSSVYHRASEELLDTVDPIIDGIIYQAQGNEMIERSKQFMPDIKWENPNNGAYYKAFIEELCMHIWGVLRNKYVSAIEWRYALPLSIENSNLFHKLWEEDINKFLKENIKINSHAIVEKKRTESEAVSLYFLTAEELQFVNADKGYMVVDIGGGSTDIAVWQKQQHDSRVSMVAQTSIPVAGRCLFTRWIALSLQQIAEQVFANENPIKSELIQLKELGVENSIVIAAVERIVNYNSDRIMKAYIQGGAWAEKLKNQLEFGVSLLFFSLGSLVGKLQGISKLHTDSVNGNFSIALGGNGSKILDWLKMRSDYPELLQMFQAGIETRKTADNSYNPQIIKSKNPKKEVAIGLVQEAWDGWDGVKGIAVGIEDDITDDLAIEWNNSFIDEYNKLFHKIFAIEEDEILNLMTRINRKTDVCNFFMGDMYAKYYMNRIKELQ